MTDAYKALRALTLRQLRTFSVIARHLSFTAAARELHVTQPAISMQVKELEELVGLPLHERVGRKLQLTEAGRELALCAQGVGDLLQQTHERLLAMKGLTAGVLKLGAISTAKYFTPSLLAAFKRRHPQITIRFTIGNREDVLRQLAENECDLAITGRPPKDMDAVGQVFAPHPLVIVAAPDHPLAGKRRVDFARLADESFLTREPGSGTRVAMEEFFRAQGQRSPDSVEMSSNETIKRAVMAGMGVAFISAHTVGLELASGRLVKLDIKGLPVMRNWYVVHLAAKRLSPIAESFREFLLEEGEAMMEKAVV